MKKTGHISATSDIFIRYLLGLEENKLILKDFINAVLADSNFELVEEITILNPFNLKTFTLDKESVLDIKASDKNGRRFDIEIQVSVHSAYTNRSLYYWARNYQEQLGSDKDYRKLRPMICVNILDDIVFEKLEAIHTCFLAIEKDNPEYCLSKDFQIHFIELPKLEKTKNLTKTLYSWLWYLRNEGKANKEEYMEVLLKENPVLQQAHDNYRQFTADDQMRELYEARRKRIMDETTALNIARDEGIEQGMEQGMQQGVLQTAQRMKQKGFDISSIQAITGLDEKTIEEL